MAEEAEKKDKPAAKAKAPAAAKATKEDDGGKSIDTLWSRREFFSLTGWASFLAAVGLSSVYFLRLLFPRVLFEPSPIFKAGLPDDYTVGEVSNKYKQSERVWIVREKEGIYAILAKCTHLGCTPLWLKGEGKYKCPCHGSGFTMQGVNFEGPAPRALERLKITLGPDGQLLIDKSKVFLFEKGEWDKAEAILRV